MLARPTKTFVIIGGHFFAFAALRHDAGDIAAALNDANRHAKLAQTMRHLKAAEACAHHYRVKAFGGISFGYATFVHGRFFVHLSGLSRPKNPAILISS